MAATVQRLMDGGQSCGRSQQNGLPEQLGLTVNVTRHIEPGRLGPTVECDLHKVFIKLGMTARAHLDRALRRG